MMIGTCTGIVNKPSGTWGFVLGHRAELKFYKDNVRGNVPFEELKGRKVYYEEGLNSERGVFARYVKAL